MERLPPSPPLKTATVLELIFVVVGKKDSLQKKFRRYREINMTFSPNSM